jgi:uncharacterized membrane protein
MWLFARASKGLPSSVVTALNCCWGPVLLLCFLPFVEFPWDQWWWYAYLILPWVLLPLSAWVLTHACQRIDVTVINPLSALSTIATLLTAVVLFSRSFEQIHILGIVIITSGLLFLYHNRWHTWKTTWLWLSILAVIIMGINASILKEVISLFPHPIAILAIGETGSFSFLVLVSARKDWKQVNWTKRNILLVSTFSFVVFAQAILIFLALALGPAPHVIAIKRTSILLTALGGYLIFKEKDQSILRLVTSCVIVVAGAILLNL